MTDRLPALPDGADEYLAQVDDADLKTIAELSAALATLQRIATTVGARLSLELAELDGVHHAVVERVTATNEDFNRQQATLVEADHIEARQNLGRHRQAETIVENAKQRTEFLRARLSEHAASISIIRRGIVDLQQSQQAFRVWHEATK